MITNKYIKTIPIIICALMVMGVLGTFNSSASVTNSNASSAGSSSLFNIYVKSNTTLHSNIIADNMTIESGVTLTTNGYSIILSGTFVNKGIIVAGYDTSGFNAAGAQPNLPLSIGGSGGGSGISSSSGIDKSDALNWTAGSTRASAGANNYKANGTNGSSPSAPSIDNKLLDGWYNSGIQSYISGADGASTGNYRGGLGGYGSYGIYIEANRIVAGQINVTGESVPAGYHYATPGAGGAGVIILSYGTGGFVKGTYNISGGSTTNDLIDCVGGNGGNGQVIVYNYGTTPPVKPVHMFLQDGMFAKYSETEQVSADGIKVTSASGYVNYSYNDISILNNTVNMSEFVDMPSSYTSYGLGIYTHYYNSTDLASGFTTPLSGNKFFIVNATDITALNQHKIPITLSNELGYASDNNISLGKIVALNTSLTVKAGTFIADEITGESSNGNVMTVWISPSSGLVLKKDSTAKIGAGDTITTKASLASTDIPSKTALAPIYIYLIIGGVVAAGLIVLFVADRKGVIDVKKRLKFLSKSGKERKIKIAKIENLRKQHLISEDEYNEMIKKLK